MARRSFTHEVAVQASVDEIWTRLQDANTWTAFGAVDRVWNPGRDDRGYLTGFQWSSNVAGREYEGKADRIEVEPPRSMALRLHAGEIRGVLCTSAMPNGTGSSFRVTLDIEPRGTLAMLSFTVIAEAVGRGLPRQVDEFASSFDEPDGFDG